MKLLSVETLVPAGGNKYVLSIHTWPAVWESPDFMLSGEPFIMCMDGLCWNPWEQTGDTVWNLPNQWI
jgi:hypothetical protein